MKLAKITTLCLLLLCNFSAGSGAAQQARPKHRPITQPYEEGLSPLMRAAAEGRLKTVRRLLKSGVDANEANAIGLTALMLAARSGRLGIVKALLAAGANPNAVGGVAHGGIFSVLTLAMNKRNKNWLEVVDTLIAAGAKVNPPPDYPSAPINYAIEQRDLVMLKALLSRGADVNWKNSNGHTPLVTAITSAEPDVRIVRALLDAGADPNLPRLIVGDSNVSLLAFLDGWLESSRDADREEIVRLLKKAGARR